LTLLFEQAWRTAFAGGRPLAYLLRDPFKSRWVRFHSLPESKRYAENDREMAIILQRQNALAADLFGEGRGCFMIQSRRELEPGDYEYSDYDAPIREQGLSRTFDFFDDDEPEEGSSWAAYAGQVVWSHGVFDSLLKRIANEEVAFLMWMDPQAGSLFAPYDGGVDIFLPTPADRDALKDRHRAWLSVHPSGL
jgi:hypothetical protein